MDDNHLIAEETLSGRTTYFKDPIHEGLRKLQYITPCLKNHKLVDHLQPKLIKKAVTLLEKASRVMCFGSGGSMILASECANLFSTVTDKVFAVADTHSQISTLATMGKNDILILFSYSGATTSGVRILELAQARGIRCILITRFSKSPAAKLAEVVLCCGTNEGPYQFGSVPAKIAQLVIVDFLFQEYFHRNREACEENRIRIGAALAEMHI